jgi:hypothetical protein
MNIRTKTVLVLTATLIAGAVIGALISGAIRRQHINRVFQMREPAGFVGFAEEIIKPTDAQKDTVRKILVENHRRLLELRTRHMKDMSAQMDSLTRKLEGVLTQEQVKRLSGFEGRMNPKGEFGRPPFPPADFTEPLFVELRDRLKLTDIQAEEVQKILFEAPNRRKGDRRQFAGDPSLRFQAMKERLEAIDAKIASVLTPEQKNEFKKFRKERREMMRPFNP